MTEFILDGVLDTIKIVPFLFIAFLLMEKIEHEINNSFIEKFKKNGPITGAILGLLPQCGFSVAATSLYSARIITIGTLIAVYLSTSDEMLAIMLSKGFAVTQILLILSIKLVVAIIAGLLIDKFFKNKKFNIKKIKKECSEEHCGCNESILISSIKHTTKISLFILIFNIFLNIIIEKYGIEFISNILLKDTIFGPFLSSLIGLIPNCASSILITELYLTNAITFGSMMAGLLTGSGIAILVLFKTNKNIKENIIILSFIYIVGSLVGLLTQIIW